LAYAVANAASVVEPKIELVVNHDPAPPADIVISAREYALLVLSINLLRDQIEALRPKVPK
jgi:hypothetical protein